MSLKNDINMVKEELSSEEKFFEKAVITEKFVKKYKNVLIGSVVAVTLFVAGSITYTQMEESRVADANSALHELQSSNNNTATLARLESLSPVLYDVWKYSQAIAEKNMDELAKLQSSKAMFIADLSSYEVAQGEDTLDKLETYAQKQGAVYADLANVEAAVILMSKQEIDAAHDKLKLISVDSPLAQVAQALMHYGVK
ncbi:MAG: hypothetical protein JXQ67_06945 [Campylobacterales bacterium]|nr:hypothetical protein [Campylobacterales bacterium]